MSAESTERPEWKARCDHATGDIDITVSDEPIDQTRVVVPGVELDLARDGRIVRVRISEKRPTIVVHGSGPSAVAPEERDALIRDTAEYVRKYETQEADVWAQTPEEAATALVDGFIRYFTNRTGGGS